METAMFPSGELTVLVLLSVQEMMVSKIINAVNKLKYLVIINLKCGLNKRYLKVHKMPFMSDGSDCQTQNDGKHV